MRRHELAALCTKGLTWEKLSQLLPKTLEGLGLAYDEAATDGAITLYDHGDSRVVVVDRTALARRAALSLSTVAQVSMTVYEVVGTAGEARYRFRTAAQRTTADGALLPAEGAELDLEDAAQQWGGGDLESRTIRVLHEFARIEGGPIKTVVLGYKKRPKGRPSTPRVATLLASLQKAKSHEAVPQPDGRVELKITLAAGGKQSSFCSAAEAEELAKLTGG